MAKTYDYIIVLKKKSFSVIDSVSKLMLLMAIAAFSFDAFYTLSAHNTKLTDSSAYLLIVITVAIVGWWSFCGWQIKKGATPYYRFALMFAAWGWYVVPNGFWISLVYVIACFLEKPAKVPQEIAFDNSEIIFNSLPKKKYLWNEISNIVLKDGLITIDLKNNTLIQKSIDEPTTKEVEEEFNAFCKELIVVSG